MLKRQHIAMTLLCLLCCVARMQAQKCEYWFDSDYSGRKAGDVSNGEWSMSISLDDMSPGLHCFNFRATGDDGTFGPTARKMFYYAPELAVASTQMKGYDLWFDDDYDSRIRGLYLTPHNPKNAITLELDLSKLAEGLHAYNFRSYGSGSTYSPVTRKLFYYHPALGVASDKMVRYETWIDNDHSWSRITESSDGSLTLSIDLDTLKTGLHCFNFRAQGAGDVWGPVTRKMFYLAPVEKVASATAIRYRVGDGEWTEQEVSGAEIVLQVDIADLEPGTHTFTYCLLSDTGTWGAEHTEEFTIENTPLDGDEWELLVNLYKSIRHDWGWTPNWNIDGGIEAVPTFEGVTMQNGHVVGFDFSGKYSLAIPPTSYIPNVIFKFPYLKSLNISNNSLTTDIGNTFGQMAKEGLPALAKLEKLDISHNRMTGNLGALASQAVLPSLVELYASYNRIADIYPALPARIAKFDCGHQTIDQVVTMDVTAMQTMFNGIDFAAITTEEFLKIKDKVPPTVTLYNHALGTWLPTNGYLLTTAAVSGFKLGATDDWTVALAWNGLSPYFPYVSEDYYSYSRQSGDTINAIVITLDPDDTSKIYIEGTSFRVKLTFRDGDVNFDGAVNVTDLQAIVNYILGLYRERSANGEFKPFNFTAANQQRKDNDIDVRDAVLLVKLLLNQIVEILPPPPLYGTRVAPAPEQLAYNDGGMLCISSAEPVAALELTIVGDDDIQVARILAQHGLTCEKQCHDDEGVTRVVAYSMDGNTLPAGVTQLGRIGDNQVVGVVLSDINANAITEPSMATGIDSIAGNIARAAIVYDGNNLVVAANVALTNAKWSVYSADGMLLGQGAADTLPAGCNAIDCGTHASGMAIVVVEADQIAPLRRKIMIGKH